MILDSCYLCGRLFWLKDIFCESCHRFWLKKDLLHRHQNELKVYSLGLYKEEMKDFVLRCKQGNEPELLRELSRTVSVKALDLMTEKVNGIIPVPSSKQKEDHAFLIATTVAEVFGVPLMTNLAIPSSDLDQKSKVLEARLEKGFKVINLLPQTTQGVWILVDDVITTGATLSGLYKAIGGPPAIGLTLASRPYVLVS